MSLTVLQVMGVRCYAFIALPLAVICYFIASTPIAGDPTTSPLGLSQALYKAVFYAVIAALAVAPLALGNQGWYCRFLATRPMVWLGEISYEIFLIHLVTMEIAMVYVMQDHVYTGSMAWAVCGDDGAHHPAGLAAASLHPGAQLTLSSAGTTHRDDELLDHRLLVGHVAAGEHQQRRDHPDQPAAAACDGCRVVGAERVDECGGQRGDHVGLLGQFGADRRPCRREPRLPARGFRGPGEAW